MSDLPRAFAILPCTDLDAAEQWWNRLGLSRPVDQGHEDYRMLADGAGTEVHLNAAVPGWLVPERNPFGVYVYSPRVDALAETMREAIIERGKRHPGNSFVERIEHEWPLARTDWQDWHLDCRTLTLALEPPDADGAVAYDGFGDGVTFVSAPFDRATEFTGPASLRLRVASSTRDADLFVVLRLFAPDLKEVAFVGSQDPLTPATMGWLRASHRKLDPSRSTTARPWHSHDALEPLSPGVPVDVDVELWPASIVVPAGYRIGISVRGRDYAAPAAPPPSKLLQG